MRGSKTGLTEAVELRRMLEPPIARLQRRAPLAADIERLAAILVRMEAALTDVPRWIEADLDFHEAIAASAGNRLLDLQMQGAAAGDPRGDGAASTRAAPAPRPTGARPIKRHVQVVDAIRAGDAEAAERAMSKHFEAAEAAIAELATIREEEIHGNRDRAGP